MEQGCIRFILKYYDHLPEHIAFIHGHEHAWHQVYPGGGLLDAIKDAKVDEFDYINFNVAKIDDLRPENPYWNIVADVWPEHFEPYTGVSMPLTLDRVYGCAQFVVARRQILKYPKHVWQHWLDLLMQPELVPNGKHFYMPWSFEYTWHVIFGQEPTAHYGIPTDAYYNTHFVIK